MFHLFLYFLDVGAALSMKCFVMLPQLQQALTLPQLIWDLLQQRVPPDSRSVEDQWFQIILYWSVPSLVTLKLTWDSHHPVLCWVNRSLRDDNLSEAVVLWSPVSVNCSPVSPAHLVNSETQNTYGDFRFLLEIMLILPYSWFAQFVAY